MDIPPTMRVVLRRIVAGGAAVSLAALVAGCQTAPVEENAAALAALRPARTCKASLPWFGRYPTGTPFDIYRPPDGRIAMANDGGWCTIVFTYSWRSFPGEIIAPLSVRKPPAHGQAMVGAFGKAMRIAYRPDPGYVGPDAFTVHMLAPDGWNIPVQVSVTR